MYWVRSRFRWRSSNAITWSSKSRRQLPTQRSATPFCQGLRIEVRTGVMFSERIDAGTSKPYFASRSEEHTSELQSLRHLVCRLLLEKKILIFRSCEGYVTLVCGLCCGFGRAVI